MILESKVSQKHKKNPENTVFTMPSGFLVVTPTQQFVLSKKPFRDRKGFLSTIAEGLPMF